MSWGNNLSLSHAPCIRSYKEALAAWENAGTWRKKPDNVRILTARKHYGKQIVRRGDDSIALRLWSTDVVIYEPGGDIVLNPYSSRTTDTFADHFLPMAIHPHFAKGAVGVRNMLDGRWRSTRYERVNYPTRLRLTEDDDYPWRVIDPKPWRRLRIDTEKMRAACDEAGLTEFCAAAPAMFAIAGYHNTRAFWWHGTKAALDRVRAGPTEWMGFVESAGIRNGRYTLAVIIAKLRKAVAHRAHAYREEHFPFVLGYNELTRAYKDTL